MNNNYPRFFKKIPDPIKRQELVIKYQSGDTVNAMKEAYQLINATHQEESSEFKKQVWTRVFTDLFHYL